MTNYYKSQSEIEAVVRGFETCSLGKDEFPHQAHLTVAVWYLTNSSLEQATDRMRAGLYRFLKHHGVGRQKYNETLTVFWMRAISAILKQLSSELSLLEVTNSAIECLTDSELAFECYSREVLMSNEAKQAWVEPDRISNFELHISNISNLKIRARERS
jgi:hypothetical protein